MIIYPETLADTIRMADWACVRLGEPIETFGFDRFGRPLFQCLGFGRSNPGSAPGGEVLLCVVIAYHRSTHNVFMAFAADSPRWASKENIAALGAWAFVQLGVQRITATVKKTNKRARKFDEGIGFKVEGNLRKFMGGTDAIVYGLLKSEHEDWLRKAFHGQERQHAGKPGRSLRGRKGRRGVQPHQPAHPVRQPDVLGPQP